MTNNFCTGALFTIEQERRLFVDELLSHVGTPYQFQGRDSFGMDCGGLITASLLATGYQPREPEAFHKTDYPDYAHGLEDDYLERIVAGEANEIERAAMQPGDLMLFRWPTRFCAQHVGVVTRIDDPHTRDFYGHAASYFVHCDPREGGVIQTRLDGAWLRLLTGVHCFKDWMPETQTQTT